MLAPGCLLRARLIATTCRSHTFRCSNWKVLLTQPCLPRRYDTLRARSLAVRNRSFVAAANAAPDDTPPASNGAPVNGVPTSGASWDISSKWTVQAQQAGQQLAPAAAPSTAGQLPGCALLDLAWNEAVLDSLAQQITELHGNRSPRHSFVPFCRLIDRNLARKYGLNEGLLRSVMDMPHSQSQSTEQVGFSSVAAALTSPEVAPKWLAGVGPLCNTC